jgi:hypothetical protein
MKRAAGEHQGGRRRSDASLRSELRAIVVARGLVRALRVVVVLGERASIGGRVG